MARSLTKHRQDGRRYMRPPNIDESIDSALKEDIPGLIRRIRLQSGAPGYLPSECLVHLLRAALRARDNARVDLVLPVLTKRCAAVLEERLPDNDNPLAADLRQEVLDRLLDLFLDPEPEHEQRLDYYEVKFNSAFFSLRMDVLRSHKSDPRIKSLADVTAQAESSGSTRDGELLKRAVSTPATQLATLRCADLAAAVNTLDPDVRQTVMLRHMGYEIESKDPGKRTIATIQRISGRAVDKRLARAAKTLSLFSPKA
jgi:hypothetical protein